MDSSYTTSTDIFVRFDKGTTGFLDLFTQINQHQVAIFQPLLAPAGEQAKLLIANILDLAKFSTATEIKVRENERLMKLGRANLTKAFDPSAALLNQQAIRSAGRALKFVNQMRDELRQGPSPAGEQYRILPEKVSDTSAAVGNPPRGISELRAIHNAPEFPAVLTDVKDAFLNSALQLNFTNNGEFVEVLEIWDTTMARAAKEGVAGVLSSMAELLEQFIARRNSEERGTSPASPLAWWKYVVIGLYIGTAAFAVFACFWWSACTWVWPAIAATAPWIFKIIEMGC